LSRQYKTKISDFRDWKSKVHAKEYLIYPKNISKQLSIDETAFTNGDLYTIVTSKHAKGRKGCIVAIIKGVKVDKVTDYLKLIPKKHRDKVKEITLEMAHTMVNICKNVFPKATQVTDRFHVQKLANDAVQNIRIKYRWEALDIENSLYEKAKIDRITYAPSILSNGDTVKQLLARSRYLLFKHHSKWTESQKIRACILFSQYPKIKQAYDLSNGLRIIYNNCYDKGVAMTKLAQWYNEIEMSEFKSFKTVMNTISLNYRGILNYFENRSTNASAESFNAKIKAFRSQLRGGKNKEFFLFRLTKIYA
jgi:transposase